jgi:hypothetical protein
MAWTVLICLRMEQVAGSCERGNELSGSIKCEEVLAEELTVSRKGLAR